MGKLLFGVGICDGRAKVLIDGKRVTSKQRNAWSNMLQRCYSEKYQQEKPTYIGCTVCEEWLTYSKFKEWFDANYVDGWQLDKDLLIEGNKVYSPEACTFVPRELNVLFTGHEAKRGEYPIGVNFNKDNGKFKAACSMRGKAKHIGYYPTPEQASAAYQAFKKGYVLGEIAAYREAYSDNKPLMKLLDAIESRYTK